MAYEPRPSHNSPTPKNFLSVKNMTLSLSRADGTVIREYPLERVSKAKLKELREHGASFCLVTINGKYAVAMVPKWFSLSGVRFRHLCAECGHCYAKPENYGGCSKILDSGTINLYDYTSIEEAIEDSARTEKYPFIQRGIEVFHGNNSTFYILGCGNFLKDDPEKPRSKLSVETLFGIYSHYKEGATVKEFFAQLSRAGREFPPISTRP